MYQIVLYETSSGGGIYYNRKVITQNAETLSAARLEAQSLPEYTSAVISKYYKGYKAEGYRLVNLVNGKRVYYDLAITKVA